MELPVNWFDEKEKIMQQQYNITLLYSFWP